MPLRLDADVASRSKLIINNIRIQLPPVALISVSPMTTIICEGFSLVGRPLSKTNSSITLISNGTLHRTDIDIFNITMKLHENWDVKQFNTKSIDDILGFIEKTPSVPPNTSFYFSFISSIWETITIIVIIALSIIVPIIGLICCYKRGKICSYVFNRISEDRNVEIDLQEFDCYSANQLKCYYDRIKQSKV